MFPRLSDALASSPRHTEAVIATSLEGIVLAEACPVAGIGSVLGWVLTVAGTEVRNEEDRVGWTLNAPTLSPKELDDALAIALAEDFARAS